MKDKELKDFENKVDEYFLTLPYPTNTLANSVYHTLATYEDNARLMVPEKLANNSQENMPELLAFINIQRDGFNLYLRGLFKNKFKVIQNISNRKIDGKVYVKLVKHLIKMSDYALIVRMFYSIYHNTVEYEICDSGKTLKIIPKRPKANIYGALEFFNSPFYGGLEHIIEMVLGFLMGQLEDWPAVEMIIDSVEVHNKRIKYNLNDTLCFQLMLNMPAYDSVLVKEWTFPWGTIKDTHKMVKALHSICFFHYIANIGGAIKSNIQGGGADEILLNIRKEELIERIEKLSTVPRDIVSNFIQFITYSYNTTSPDISLQPLIESNDYYVISCLNLLSSNYERNLLSLHARIDSSSFDTQSHVFEMEMLNNLEQVIDWKKGPCKKNLDLTTDKQIGDVDFIIVDKTEKRIVFLELKWMIPASDAIEVIRRGKVCDEKVTQIEKKVEHYLDMKLELLNHLLPSRDNNDFNEWEINGIVVIQGYGGVYSSQPFAYPIMPIDYFQKGLIELQSLEKLFNWVTSYEWLPKEGKDFELVEEDIKFGDGYRIQAPRVSLSHVNQYIKETFTPSIEKFT